MKLHSWLPSQINKLECAVCSRPYLSHTVAATCEACGAIRECDIFGSPKSSSAMLLCPECTAKEIAANDKVLQKTSVLMDAAKIDDSITYNGDVFNAKTVALIELKKAIDAETDIDEQQKKYKFQEVIAARYEKLKKTVFLLEKKKEELVIEQLVIAKNIRALGDEIRKDIRARIAESDANYVPPIRKIIRPTVKPAEKKSAIDILIDKFMLMSDKPITREQALEEIRKFKKDI